jgi:hypothetical protein
VFSLVQYCQTKGQIFYQARPPRHLAEGPADRPGAEADLGDQRAVRPEELTLADHAADRHLLCVRRAPPAPSASSE